MGLPQNEVCLITPSVRDEVAKGRPARTLESMMSAGLEVREPSEGSAAAVEKAAGETGDARRMSPADRDSIALALDTGGVLLTDDYSMQNTASRLGVQWRGVMQKGITEQVEWVLRCRGCGRRFQRGEAKGDECPVCGSGLRQVRK